MDITETARYFNGLPEFKSIVRKGILNFINDVDDINTIYQDTGNNRKVSYKKDGVNYFVFDYFDGQVNVYAGEYFPSDRLPPEVANTIGLLVMQADTEYFDLPQILSFNENVNYHFIDDDISEFTTSYLCKNKEQFASLKSKNKMFKELGDETDFDRLKSSEIKSKYLYMTEQYFKDTLYVSNSADLFNLTTLLKKEKVIPNDKMFSLEAYLDCNKFVGITYDGLSHNIVDNIDNIFSSVSQLKGEKISNEIWKDNNRLFVIKENLLLVVDKGENEGDYKVYMRENDSIANFARSIDDGKIDVLTDRVMVWSDYMLVETQECYYQVADLMLQETLLKLDEHGVVKDKERNMKLN